MGVLLPGTLLGNNKPQWATGFLHAGQLLGLLDLEAKIKISSDIVCKFY